MLSVKRAPKRRKAGETNQGAPTSSTASSVPSITQRSPVGARLLDYHSVPLWYREHDYIRTGYRPVTASVQQCLISLGYLHNETLNIYTHLVPTAGHFWAMEFLLSILYRTFPMRPYRTRPSSMRTSQRLWSASASLRHIIPCCATLHITTTFGVDWTMSP